MLNVVVEASAACGLPVPIENRPTTGMSACVKTRALDNGTAAPLERKVPAKQIPLPCARRKPGGNGCGVSDTSDALVVRDPIQPAVHARADVNAPATTAIAASAPQVRFDVRSSFDIDGLSSRSGSRVSRRVLHRAILDA
ncbi:hypothetical protein [Burkholderia pseudomultivorans]|uniref:hypothetical protein n=1 Tax=Burkholderia pseudomultivorans TaxID=1207504 RepID=UPI001E4277C7|nr:hypothetical protein [Burkholderia pseudomultivorans]